mmetsp:Transcript_44966/g.102136  ORF Transcript_44966/g.102136 Transcript_44966/m.102136 type:complete len:200 (-) Transcript_44966:31-630(-)
MRRACRLCCMSSVKSPLTLSNLISISFMLSTCSESSCRDSRRVCLSCSSASWQGSRINSCCGRASRSCRRRSQTLRGDHLDLKARCSWKRHSPACRMVSSTLSMRSSRALIRSSVIPIFFLIVWDTMLPLVCSCLFAWLWTESLSTTLFSACLVNALAWARLSMVFCSHLSLLAAAAALLPLSSVWSGELVRSPRRSKP